MPRTRTATAIAAVLVVAGGRVAGGTSALPVYPEPGGAGPGPPAAAGADTIPGNSLPTDTLPLDTVPGDTIPADTLPRDTLPADTLPEPVPDSLVGPPAGLYPELFADTIFRPGADTAGTGEALEEFVSEFTDLGLRFRGRMELGGEWSRFRPCDAEVQTTCEPTLFPQLSPDFQFGLDVGGTISDRISVDVDYDETREFSATNNINVFYTGREGEFLQRVEVGDVTFDLPESRYLTRGIPAGNFGLRADARAGPLSLQTVWAEQGGEMTSRTFRLQGLGDERGFVQADTLVLDDADYVRGQFFFLVDPTELAGWPHVDALSLTPSAAPADVAPGGVPVQVYRFEADPVTRQQVEGYIQADAVAGSGEGRVEESGWFRYLQPGVDYMVHSSGLWLALRRPLGRDEMLAVTYVTAAGDSVGDYNPERIHNRGGRPTLQLLKASGALHQPGRPTWDREMHQVYRVSSSNDVDPASVELTISLGELSAGRTFKRGLGDRDVTFLRLFGLDEQSPVDELDRTFVYTPAEEFLGDQPPVPGTFIVFPTSRPFQRPPPVPSLGLSAEETARILGADANPRIYRDPDPVERTAGGLFRLTIPFRIQSRDVISSFSLGALGVRDGSERIYLGERRLERGVDYRIDYDIGQVTLLDPDALFASVPEAEIRATWEQKSAFRIAPTSVVGLRAHWDLSDYGGFDLLGLHQAEETLVRRPTLGVEPTSISLGGMSGSLGFDAGWLQDALERVPGLREGDSSSVSVRGELALSLPTPNTRGAVFVDDFDASDQRSVSLTTSEWRLGSAPGDRRGAEEVLPTTLDVESSAALVWQHNWIQEGAQGDSVGVFEGFLPRQDIDKQIRVAGTQRREPGLLLSFGREGGPDSGERRWRSLTTVLSPSGLDLSRSDFVEFYVADGDSLTLILDLGVVSEDAFFVDRAGRVNGVKEETGEPWGLGLLDQEADPRRGEIWSDAADRRGVWGEECLAERARVYRIGDRRANCTRGNGLRDTEDLDDNGNLDTRDRHLRYVVRLDGSSPYLARTRDETGTGFRLFRIPIRGPGGIPVGGFVPETHLRSVENLRLTLAGRGEGSAILARMRIVGSPWVERSVNGIVRGISGDVPGSGGRVEVAQVSELSEGDAYDSPPGVVERLDDPTAAFGGGGVEFKERALGIAYEGLPGGERAEVYERFPQRPRDFLTYREARIWAVARRGEWGSDEPVEFFVKVGSDPENFYLYRTRLEPAANPEAVRREDWLPEIVIDFGEWLELRRTAEIELLSNPPEPGGPPLTVWSADSTYAVVLRDRGRAPNLAAVREVSMGVWNRGETATTGEVWVNELRLASGVEEAGAAGYVDVGVRAGEVADARFSIRDRGAFFRQLELGPDYERDRSVSLRTTLSLDRFTPEEWGVSAPITVSHDRTERDPFFLSGTDVRATRLSDLRHPEDRSTRVSLSVRRRVPEEDAGWVDRLTGGLEAGAGYSRSRITTVTAEHASRGVNARLGYDRRPDSRTVPVIPDALAGVVGALLPGFLEDRLLGARLRWTPERISLGSSYFRRRSEAFRFEQILRLRSDSLVRPTPSRRETLETSANLDLRPFESLTAGLDLLTIRDLLPPEETTTDPGTRALIRRARAGLDGLDLGWETNRTLRTRLGWRPELAGWLTTDVNASTYYASLRDPNLVERAGEGGGRAVALQRNVNGQRDLRAAVTLDPDSLVGRLLGPREPDVGGVERMIQAGVRALEPLDASWEDGITARFYREPVSPGAGFQLGLAEESAFRALGGDSASVFLDREAFRASGGVRLPLDLTVQLRYRRSLGRTLDARSARRVREVTWPGLSARIGALPLPAGVQQVLSRVSLSSGFVERSQRITHGRGSEQLRAREFREVPVELTLSWAGGLRTRYRGRFEESLGTDPTGETEHTRDLHGLSVTASFPLPGALGERLERPIDVSLGWQYTADRNCRTPLGRSECVAFVDQRNRSVNLTVDSRLAQLDVGLQLSYVDRQSFVGRRLGATQFQLGLFGQFRLTAGNVAGLAPSGAGP